MEQTTPPIVVAAGGGESPLLGELYVALNANPNVASYQPLVIEEHGTLTRREVIA